MKAGWQVKTIGDVCEVIAGQSPEGKFYNTDRNGLPFYQGKKEFTAKFIGAPTTWTTSITKEAAQGDILMSVRAPVGPVNFATQPICIGRGLAAIRAGESVNKDFLFYFLRKHESELVSNTGAVFDSINKIQIQAIPLLLPPLHEQQRIVSILDQAFEGIATAAANAEKNLANAREIFEAHLHRVLRSSKYEIKPLGDLCTGVEYGTSSKSAPTGKVPVLRMGNIQDGKFDWNDLVYTDHVEDIKRLSLKFNDVLFNRTNSPELVGKTAIYKDEMPAIFAGYLIRIHRAERLLEADYLNYFLNSKQAKEYGKSVMTSSVHQANINGTKLKSYPIPAPTIDEQRVIVSKFDELSAETKKLKAIYQQKLAALNELKKSILHQAFTGQLH